MPTALCRTRLIEAHQTFADDNYLTIALSICDFILMISTGPMNPKSCFRIPRWTTPDLPTQVCSPAKPWRVSERLREKPNFRSWLCAPRATPVEGNVRTAPGRTAPSQSALVEFPHCLRVTLAVENAKVCRRNGVDLDRAPAGADLSFGPTAFFLADGGRTTT